MGSFDYYPSKKMLMNDCERIMRENTNESYSIGLKDDNIYIWEIAIIGPRDTPYENGIYRAEMIFPIDYPNSPPTFRFITPMWHPNIDKDGHVCISILHEPGHDEFGYEQLCERWLPTRTPESIILSILSLLDAPNCESPANLDAARQLRNDPEGFKRTVRLYAEKSF